MLDRGNNRFPPLGRQPRTKKLTEFDVLDIELRTVAADKIKEVRVLEAWMDGTTLFEA